MPIVRSRATFTLLSAAALLLAQPSDLCFAQSAPPGAKSARKAPPAKAPPSGKASPAGAAPSADPDARARTRFKEGVAFAKKGEWQRAYTAFIESWDHKNHPQIALNLGRAEMEIGKYRDSVTHLRYFVDNADPKDPDLKLAREWLAEAEKKVARLDITVDVAGVEVLVDGASVGKSPLAGAVLVDPGKHEIELRRDAGHERRTVEVATGETQQVKLQAGKEQPVPGTQPPAPPDVVVDNGAPPWRTPALITGTTLAVAGLVLGGVSLGLSFERAGAKDSAANDPFGLDAATRAAEEHALFQNMMVWGFVGASVAAAGTVTLFFLTQSPTKPKVEAARGPAIAPALGVRAGGPWISV
jgi:tetratricopeptide (TPR) repeat protein